MGAFAQTASVDTMKWSCKRISVIVAVGIFAFAGWVMAAIWDIVDGQSVIKTHEAIHRRITFVVGCVRCIFSSEGIDMIYVWSKSLGSSK